MAFVNNYEAGEKPDVADLNLFFKKGISAVSSNTDALEKPVEGKWVKSGDAAIASDIAEKLNKFRNEQTEKVILADQDIINKI